MSDTVTDSPPDTLAVVPNTIPTDLRDGHMWIVWRWELRRNKGKGTLPKWTKPPTSIRDGRDIDVASGRRTSWWSLAKVLAYHRAHPETAGIGWVLIEHDGLVAIDLDNVREIATGDITAEASHIINTIGSYTEVSPSGRGIRILCRGQLPPGARRRDWIEMYDSHRYVTITGHHIAGTPATIEASQDAIAAVHQRYLTRPTQAAAEAPARNGHHATSPDLSYQQLIDRMMPSRSGAKIRSLWNGEISGHGGDHSRADAALCAYLAYWCDRDPDRIDQLFRQSGLMRNKWDERHYSDGRTYGQATIEYAIAGCDHTNGERRQRPVLAAPADAGADHDRPTITIDTEEWAVNDAAVAALASDPTLYQRGGVLTHVVHFGREHTVGGITRPAGSTRIVPMAPALLRDRLTRVAEWMGWDARSGKLTYRHPPDWCVAAVAARGQWPGIRYLEGVVNAPVLRPDGTVLDAPGYDAATGLLYTPTGAMPTIDPDPHYDAVADAADLVLDVVSDFPFAGAAHRAAWLAYLLTPLARHAFEGPAPLYLIDSNVRGAGKGLLCAVVSAIVTGRDLPITTAPRDDDETRKAITAAAIAGDHLIVLDNIAGSLGCPALDAALTSTVWRDRILGRSEIAELPLRATWAATGNNVILLADTARRVAHIRLESREETPEERTGFQHPHLLAHVRELRPRLLGAALTILRGYCAAGRPDMQLTPWGSYEGWSDLVRSAVVYAGQPDPGQTRIELRRQSDHDAIALAALLAGLQYLDPTRDGLTVTEIVERIEQKCDIPEVRALREALCHLCPGRAGKDKDMGSSRAIGMRLRHLRGRVCGGRWLERVEQHRYGSRWRVGVPD